ncbi:hypothetical protein HanRHA438_Chr12g0575121 [Helianthus annuus]|nr:hypothetical protein HanRHA438_Chr12g0575121 [Helianthus annuus]
MLLEKHNPISLSLYLSLQATPTTTYSHHSHPLMFCPPFSFRYTKRITVLMFRLPFSYVSPEKMSRYLPVTVFFSHRSRIRCIIPTEYSFPVTELWLRPIRI